MSKAVSRITEMQPARTEMQGAKPGIHGMVYLKLVGIVLVALGVRLWLLTGFYGSDDLVYGGAVFSILQGDWNPRGYIGSLRYGMNVPIAASVWLFGGSEYAYALYPLACSLINIVLVWRLGKILFDESTGLIAAVLMAFCPLDIIWSGRIQADAPLMMWMSASALAFLEGCRRQDPLNRSLLCLLSGLFLGLGYTTKNVAIFLGPLFLFCLILRRAKWKDCVTAGCGFLIVAGMESLFFSLQTGDPFYAFTVQAQFNRRVVEMATEFTTSIFAYPYWALLAFQHSGFTFHLTLWLALLYWLRRARRSDAERANVTFLVAWLSLLLFFLTFYVMSWSPFMLIWKQANYMLMFVPPAVLLGACFVGLLTKPMRWVFMLAFVLSSVGFAHIEHEILAAESFNARATARFYAREAKGAPLYCGLRDCGVVMLFTEFKFRNALASYENPYGNLSAIADLARVQSGYVSVNPRWLKRSWGSLSESNRNLLATPPPAWRLVARFMHRSSGILNLADTATSRLAELGWLSPDRSASLHARLRDAIAPGPVDIYRVVATQSGNSSAAVRSRAVVP